MSTPQTQSNMLIGICATPQNSDLDAAGFGALVFVNIINVGNSSNWGSTNNINEYPTLSNGNLKQKGRFDAGTAEFEIAYIATDAGHIALEAAADPAVTSNYAFKVTYQNGDIRYARGVVVPNNEPGGGDEDFVRRAYQVGLNQNNVYVNAP